MPRSQGRNGSGVHLQSLNFLVSSDKTEIIIKIISGISKWLEWMLLERLGRWDAGLMWPSCRYLVTSCSDYNEERNLLRLRAWEQRNQETSQAKEQENVPLFGEPYKVKWETKIRLCSSIDELFPIWLKIPTLELFLNHTQRTNDLSRLNWWKKDTKGLYVSEYAEEMDRTVFSLGLSLLFPEAANSPCSLTVNKIGQAGCSLRGNQKGQWVSLCCCS